MACSAGSMLGMNRTVRAPASFVPVALSDTAAVFSNPKHDFPQTITYVRTNSDSLLTKIAGEQSGRFVSMSSHIGASHVRAAAERPARDRTTMLPPA